MLPSLRALFLLSSVVLAVGCAPKRDLQPAQIEKLGNLEEVMDVQSTVADPQMSKAGQTAYTDADWTAFLDVSDRIQVTSNKTKQFTKGPDFDALATKLGATAAKLGEAAKAKDAAAASASLAEMKATCKECHSKFR